MLQISLALGPIFLLILLGHILRQRELVASTFWKPAETLTYYVFFPALLVVNTAKAELGDLDILPLAATLTFPILLISALMLRLSSRFDLSGPKFTSIFQGGIRPNTYVGIAAASALFGPPGLTLTAICIVFVVPLVNFLAVSIMVRFGDRAGTAAPGAKTVLIEVVHNPIILACALGGLLNISGVGLPPHIIGPLLEILSRAALPVGLLAVGAGLDFQAARASARAVGFSSTVKLILLPTLTFVSGYAFGVEGLTLTIALIYSSLPCSASSYVLARQMGGDAILMAGIITVTTLAAMVTIPTLLIVKSFIF